MGKKIAVSIIKNFFVQIYKGKLSVRVGDSFTINENSLPALVAELFDKDSETAAYYQTLTSEESVKVAEVIPGFGEVKLNLLAKSGFPKKIAMTRKTGMLIYSKGHFRTALKFAGVLQIGDNEANAFLQHLEPPSHDD